MLPGTFHRHRRALLLALAVWAAPLATHAMEARQMRAMAGLAMLDAPVAEVIRTYGRPAAVCSSGTNDCVKSGSAQSGLPDGDWDIVYAPAPAANAKRGAEDAVASGTLAFSRIVLHAKSGVGRVSVRPDTNKLAYEVPADPYLSHQVASVRAQLSEPVPLEKAIGLFGKPDQRITDADGNQSLRYWVLRKERQVPIRLYAVELGLDPEGSRVTAIKSDGPLVDAVAAELHARHETWERNLYD